MMQTRRTLLRAAAVQAGLGMGLARAADLIAPALANLGPIRAVTITTGDLQAAEEAWTRFMGYRLIRKGAIPAAVATGWGAPALAGKGFVALGPESGEDAVLRFVEQPTPPGDASAGTAGWTTTEITVQDSDKLYERLKNSPFTIDRPPALVPTYSYLKAMQATGPAGEKLNLTWITEKRPDLAVAESFVGRCFIAVQRGPDLPGALRFYQRTFGNTPGPIRPLPGLDLAVMPLGEGDKIEFDQFPGATPPRVRPPGGLPPGLAMVTFDCRAFDQLTPSFLAPAYASALEPRAGRRAGTMVGPSGELIELLDV